MQTRKICVVGDFAVGKTSLISRLVHDRFSEEYRTTVGVQIDAKTLELADGRRCKLIIWDIAGTDTPTALFLRYTRGASGYLLVADSTRAETLGNALALKRAIDAEIGALPCVLALNKADLTSAREIDKGYLACALEPGVATIFTSACTGENVEAAFIRLIEQMEG